VLNGLSVDQILDLPLASLPLAFFDVETTGASPQYGDRIIELGLARVQGGEIVEEWQQLLDPSRFLPRGITYLTGISADMLVDQPTFPRVLPEFMSRIREHVIVGHNVQFDLGFLGGEFERMGLGMDQLGESPIVLDTVRIARKLFGRGGNGLQKLATRLGCPAVTAHRALADCVTTYHVLRLMLEPLGGFDIPLRQVLELQNGNVRVPTKASEQVLPADLAEALAYGKVVKIEYLDTRNAKTVREIRPVNLRRSPSGGTLIAHCLMRDAQRTFKLERIISVEMVETEEPPIVKVLEEVRIEAPLDPLTTAKLGHDRPAMKRVGRIDSILSYNLNYE
jgi:DNA polymerase III epsilon subunit family exonuclease